VTDLLDAIFVAFNYDKSKALSVSTDQTNFKATLKLVGNNKPVNTVVNGNTKHGSRARQGLIKISQTMNKKNKLASKPLTNNLKKRNLRKRVVLLQMAVRIINVSVPMSQKLKKIFRKSQRRWKQTLHRFY